MPINRIPFGVFNPDASDRENTTLNQATNVAPLFGGYLTVPGLEASGVGAASDTDYITGGHSHLLSQEEALQFARPSSDFSVGSFRKVTRKGTTNTDLYKAIDETRPSGADFITINDPTGAGYIYKVDLSAISDPGAPPADSVKYRYAYRLRDASGSISGSFRVDLYDTNVVLPIDQDEVAGITEGTDGWVVREQSLDIGEEGNITDYSDLQLWFINGVSGGIGVINPDADLGNSGGWVNDAGGSELYSHVDDAADDTDYIVTPEMSAGGHDFWGTVGLPNILDPDTHEEHAIRVRAYKKGTTGTVTLTAKLKQGNTVIADTEVTLTGSFATTDYDLTEAEANSITNYDDLRIVFRAKNSSTDDDVQVYVSALQFVVPNQDTWDVSWAELEAPAANTSISNDVPIQYVGTETALYELTGNYLWSDVSIAGGYTTGTKVPKSWDFCSWGSDVIATNYIDKLQVRQPGDALFSNLIDTGAMASDEYEPRARFCAVVKNFLVLADINGDGTGAGGASDIDTDLPGVGSEFVVWWSAINANQTFKAIDLATQSSYAFLRQTPGAITGLVGGDYGIIFKGRSILRMSYLGAGFPMFRFDVLSWNEGCPYPRSIVPFGRDIYFMGTKGVSVVRNGSSVESISDDVLTRYLLDREFSDRGIFSTSSGDPRDTDSLMIGAPDIYTNTIWWLYTPQDATGFHRETDLLIYNVGERRFSVMQPTAGSNRPFYDHIQGLGALVGGGSHLFHQPQLFDFDPVGTGTSNHAVNHYTGRVTEPVTLVSQILSAQVIAGQGDAEPQDIVIRGVRPVFSTIDDPTASQGVYPPVTITVVSTDDPEMRNDQDTGVGDYDERDRNGMYPLDNLVSGGYFYYKVEIPAFQGTVRQFAGLEIQWEPVGDEG
jgi:hypothetical protein